MSIPRAVRLVVTGLLNRLGYELRRVNPPPNDDELYAGYPPQSLELRAFINVGAGRFSHPYWTNVDYGTAWYAGQQAAGFVEYDLTTLRRLPFEDASIELAYTSHTIEHVGNEAAESLFQECLRVLKPGGALRITCPDARLLHRAVRAGRPEYWRWREPWFSGPLSNRRHDQQVTVFDYLVREIATPRCRFYVHAKDPLQPSEVEHLFRELDYRALLDRLTRDLEFDAACPGDHINWWDEDKVGDSLRQSGFARVYGSRRGQSLFAPMTNERLFDSTQPAGSLYVEAIR